jgi:hypothetical protein
MQTKWRMFMSVDSSACIAKLLLLLICLSNSCPWFFQNIEFVSETLIWQPSNDYCQAHMGLCLLLKVWWDLQQSNGLHCNKHYDSSLCILVHIHFHFHLSWVVTLVWECLSSSYLHLYNMIALSLQSTCFVCKCHCSFVGIVELFPEVQKYTLRIRCTRITNVSKSKIEAAVFIFDTWINPYPSYHVIGLIVCFPFL